MTPTDAAARVDRHFRLHYGRGLDEYEIADTPGYWRQKEPCGGSGTCSAPIHGCLGNREPTRHTASFFDPGLDLQTGRFASPYRTWRILKAAALAEA